MESGHHGAGMDMNTGCKMNMEWNYETEGICLVFKSLKITSPASALFYCSFLFFLAVTYEFLRLRATSFDLALKRSLRTQAAIPLGRRESGLATVELLPPRRLPYLIQAKRSFFYTLNLSISFYLMLIIMSYNAYLISSVLLGALVGHFIFHRNFDLGTGEEEAKGGGACH